MAETMTRRRSPLMQDIIDHVKAMGSAPSPERIRDMAVFTEPGGIARLCYALQASAEVFAMAMRAPR